MVTTARPKMDAAVQTILEVSMMPTFHQEGHKRVKFSVFCVPISQSFQFEHFPRLPSVGRDSVILIDIHSQDECSSRYEACAQPRGRRHCVFELVSASQSVYFALATRPVLWSPYSDQGLLMGELRIACHSCHQQWHPCPPCSLSGLFSATTMSNISIRVSAYRTGSGILSVQSI